MIITKTEASNPVQFTRNKREEVYTNIAELGITGENIVETAAFLISTP